MDIRGCSQGEDLPASSRFHNHLVGLGKHGDQKRNSSKEGKLRPTENTTRPIDSKIEIDKRDRGTIAGV